VIPTLQFPTCPLDYFSGSVLTLTEEDLLLHFLAMLKSEPWDREKRKNC